MTNKPFLTIAIPTYNRAAALEQTLGIVVPQLDSGSRLVVIDNASSDDTAAVCDRYVRTGAPIDIIRNRVNIGANANISLPTLTTCGPNVTTTSLFNINNTGAADISLVRAGD